MNKSTVPVGSTKVVERVLKRPDVRVVSNPEFLREGSAVDDFLRPDRVVVGCDDRSAAIAVGNLYDKVRAQVIVTDPASAETIKYAANTFLATKLSFINAIAAVCEGVGADVDDVVVGHGLRQAHRHRVPPPRPGMGWELFRRFRDPLGPRRLRHPNGPIRPNFGYCSTSAGLRSTQLEGGPGHTRVPAEPTAVTERPYTGAMIDCPDQDGPSPERDSRSPDDRARRRVVEGHANARALRHDLGAAPILLLDEVAAHLDEGRRKALYDEIVALGAQALMTGTEVALFDSLGPRGQYFTVTEHDGQSRIDP